MPVAPKMPGRKFLTLDDRVKVVKLSDSGKSSRDIAGEMGVGRTQILGIVKRKREIMDEYEGNANGNIKRPRRATTYDDVNNLCMKWFTEATGRKVNVSGPLLKEKALKFAQDLGLVDFKSSNGWLDSFLKRNNIVFKTMSGERGSVNMDVVSDWKIKLKEVCDGFEPHNIFNMDETGLVFRDTTNLGYSLGSPITDVISTRNPLDKTYVITPDDAPVDENPMDVTAFDITRVRPAVSSPLTERSIGEAALTDTVLEDDGSVTFTIVEEGTIRKMRKLVSSDGFSYTVKINRTSSVHWRCSVRRKDNLCYANVTQKGDVFTTGRALHTHQPDPLILKLLLQEAKLVNIQHQLVTEDAVRRHRRAIYKIMDDKIVVLWEAYDHREIVCEDFLSGIADVYCM